MKKILCAGILLFWGTTCCRAQGEQRFWAFGDKAGLDFSSGSPVPFSSNLISAYEGSASICNATGQLLFYSNGYWVWNRDGYLMPELTGGVSGITAPNTPSVGYPPLMAYTGNFATQGAAIAAMPAHPGSYYLFSMSTNGQVFYSVIDMSLNSGKGGIVAGKKGVMLTTGVTEKMTVVQGCSNNWLVVRAKAANQYRSFAITDTGIASVPVISPVGLMPAAWYRYGVIKFNIAGSKMAAACNDAFSIAGGLEVYDFDKLTGVLSHPVLLDSSSKQGYWYGACFSPDDSKLYATICSFSDGTTLHWGQVHQYDMSLGSSAAVIASHVVVFNDYWAPTLDNTGDLKRGPDNKIYFSSGKSAQPYIHCISQPNLAGTACAPVANHIFLPSGRGYRGLPNDIALYQAPDSVQATHTVTACFRSSVVLSTGAGKGYHWSDGSTGSTLTVTRNGVYGVQFLNAACTYETDSFRVQLVAMPVFGSNGYSCPHAGQGKLWVQAKDSSVFVYSWTDDAGNVLRSYSGSSDTLKGLEAGSYWLHIRTASGCDTTVSFYIQELPRPQAGFTADSLVCVGVPIAVHNTSEAPLLQWNFGEDNSYQGSTEQVYQQPGTYIITQVATNIEGCHDTAQKPVTAERFELSLVADKDLYNRDEPVSLTTSAAGAYYIDNWLPGYLFAGQRAFSQLVPADTDRVYLVIGHSALGCLDTASVRVAVNPVVVMPNAFTPNGDGVNDFFRPVASGAILVRYFEIYNRYGQMVYSERGSSIQGWDGTFHGVPCEVGTYYYHINVEIRQAGTWAYKGDVTLIR